MICPKCEKLVSSGHRYRLVNSHIEHVNCDDPTYGAYTWVHVPMIVSTGESKPYDRGHWRLTQTLNLPDPVQGVEEDSPDDPAHRP